MSRGTCSTSARPARPISSGSSRPPSRARSSRTSCAAELLFATVLAGCSGDGSAGPGASSSSATVTSSARPSSAAPVISNEAPRSPPAIRVDAVAVAVPATFTIDGDPSEWADEAQAPSRVAVAVSSKSVFLVGRVASAAGPTVTVALHHDPLTTPKNKAAPFTRVLHVDANGVTADDAALSKALAAAPFKSSKTAQGFQFESELPLDVLPRLVSVPLGALGVAAAPGASAPERFVSCSLPVPVEFEPNATVRRWVFGVGAFRVQNANAVLTYSAIDGEHVEVLQKNDRGTVDVNERTLYTKLGGDGDVEFGVVDLVGPTIIGRKGGAVTGEIHLSSLPKTFAKKKINGRDGWLGVAPKVEPANEPELPGATRVTFDTVFIDTDGNVAEGLFPPYTALWKTASPTISADLASLSIQGTLYDGITPKPGRFQWKLNAQTGYQLIE